MEIIQFPAVKHAAGTSSCCNTDEPVTAQRVAMVTSVFKKFSRVPTRLDMGVKSTILQSVIQK